MRRLLAQGRPGHLSSELRTGDTGVSVEPSAPPAGTDTHPGQALVLADIPKACGERDTGGAGKAKSGGLHEEVRHKPRLHPTVSAQSRHPALLAHGHSHPGKRNRAFQTTMLAFLAQYLRGKMVPLNAGRVVKDPGRGISAHAPFARDDAEMSQGQARPGEGHHEKPDFSIL